MMTASSGSDALQLSPDSCWPVDDGLRCAALKLLRSSGYAALRKLRCDVREAVVILHGVLPSYYLKQMAQTIVLRLDGIHSVRNLVEVRQSARLLSLACDADQALWETRDSAAW